jgi:hypothetical protein
MLRPNCSISQGHPNKPFIDKFFFLEDEGSLGMHACMQIIFLSAGDAQEEKFVKRADIWYQRDVFTSEVTWPKGSESGSKTIDLSGVEEAVRFITIVPLALEGSFSLTFRLKKMLMDGSKKNVG